MSLEINWKLVLDSVYETGKISELHKYSYEFLKKLNCIIPFYAANFFLFDEEKELIREPICFNIAETALKEYSEYYWQLDDIKKISFDQPEPIISSRLMNYDLWTKTEYFNDFLAKNRLYYSCGIDIHADCRLLGTISLFRSKKDSDFTLDDLIYLKILAKHSSNHLNKLFEIEKLKNKKTKDNNELILKAASNFNLSKREKEVLKLILKGKHNQEIANKLYISINTVKKHLSHIYNKTEVHNRTELAALIYQR
jgi:DNA-binding CsgD family transcriptional regulator